MSVNIFLHLLIRAFCFQNYRACCQLICFWLLSYLKLLKITTFNCWYVTVISGIITSVVSLAGSAVSKDSGHVSIKAQSPDSYRRKYFLFSLCFWTYLRGFTPKIEGLEKFMDYGFVNSILRSGYVPPKDMVCRKLN